MIPSAGCCHERKEKRGSGKRNVLFRQVLETGGLAQLAGPRGEPPGGQEAEDGSEENAQTTPAWRFLQEGKTGQANPFSVGSFE